MEITASITSISRKENNNNEIFFRVKDYENDKNYNCAYGGFLPLREKDNIKGFIEKIDKLWWFKELPLVIIPRHEERLYDTCFKALRGKGIHQSKVKKFIGELLSEYKDINIIYEFLSRTACEKSTELIVEAFTFEQISIFLRWWKRNIVLRQLHLWQLYDNEIKKSGYEPHELINILQNNAYLLVNLELDKASMLERLFGRKNDDNKIQRAQIYRQVLTCIKRGWCAMPLVYLRRMFPGISLHKKILEEDFSLIFENELVYSKNSYEIEDFLSDKIVKWLNRDKESRISNINLPCQTSDDIILTSEQSRALNNILKSHISVVTGGAGCGKTTLIRQLVHNLRLRGEKIMLTSFTGKAVLRMKETLPEYCQNICHTMSRLIHKKNTKQKIDNFSHLIIDEASMISHELMYQFLNIFSHYYKIYFFGDCNQLPPVGSGNFFQQLILTEKINTNYLTINKRLVSQREDNIILTNANSLIDKDRDLEKEFNFNNDKGFYALEGNIEYCQKLLKGLAKKGIKDKEITVLTPFNKDIPEIVSCHQRIFLGNKCYKYNNIKYFIGDRVMQTKNIYHEDLEVMNGEEGIIKEIDEEGILVYFNDDKNIKYKWCNNNEKLKEEDDEEIYENDITTNFLKHSFCKTVHKAQGSEYEYVLIYLPNCNNQLVNINLLYTAITRAKKMVWLIGDLFSLKKSCSRRIPSSYDCLAIKINQKY